MRIDTDEFRRSKWVRFYDDFPNAASRETWRVILANRPESTVGAMAGLRLAQLNAREGQVERARDQAGTVADRFGRGGGGEPAQALTPDGALATVLARGAPEQSLEIDLSQVVLEARRLYELISANRDPLYGYEPISGPAQLRNGFAFGLFDLDPRHESYANNLEAIVTRYPHCQIEDNILIERAQVEPILARRIELLRECLRRFPDRDAVPEAMFRLSVAYRSAGRDDDANAMSEAIAARFPQNVWTLQAMRQRFEPVPTRLTRADQ